MKRVLFLSLILFLASCANPNEKVIKINDVKVKMIKVEGGTFTMGDDYSDYLNDKPAHEVTVSDFWISETEVTNQLFYAVTGSTIGNFQDESQFQEPAGISSYYDCIMFIDTLRKVSLLPFDLPTEAQWEYAAKGGNRSKGYKYSGSDNIDEVGVYINNSPLMAVDVKSLKPNELGIYDMTGNLWEWCKDDYLPYMDIEETDPLHIGEVPTPKVLRGGGFEDQESRILVTSRLSESDFFNSARGVRLVLPIDAI